MTAYEKNEVWALVATSRFLEFVNVNLFMDIREFVKSSQLQGTLKIKLRVIMGSSSLPSTNDKENQGRTSKVGTF